MKNDELNKIIESQVNSKVLELSTWKQVRWEGGRLYYESTKISHEIAEYDTENKLLYLECLLQKKYTIQDNWPSSAPDITQDFKNWIIKSISKLKIKKLQESKKIIPNSIKKKNRPKISNKIRSLLQKEIRSKCPFCPNEDVDHFQVHHIDENPENNLFENLLMICANCHSKITKNDISKTEVLKIKQSILIFKSKEGNN